MRPTRCLLKKFKMRILMIEHTGKGGMYAYTDALCSGLCANSTDVTVLTSSAWPKLPRPFRIERRMLNFSDNHSQWSKLHWAADRISRSLCNSFRRNRFAIRRDFDVIHIQGAGTPLLDQFFLKPLAKRMPVVLTVHDVKSHYERFVSRDSFLKRSLQIPHRLIVHYELGRKQLVEDWGVLSDRIDVIPHGIMPLHNPPEQSQARKKLNLPSDRRILLFFGGIRPNKGLDILLEALEIVRLRDPGILLVVAGNLHRGMIFEPYSNTIERLDLSQHVRSFVHFITEEDVDFFFSACDLIVLPYLTFEAQSGVLLRAYAHKKPVVVSNVGAMGQLVSSDKVGLVVEPGAPDSLAKAIISVLDNPGKFQSRYNPELESRYSFKHIAELTKLCYKKVIASMNSNKHSNS